MMWLQTTTTAHPYSLNRDMLKENVKIESLNMQGSSALSRMLLWTAPPYKLICLWCIDHQFHSHVDEIP
ncbi:Hypothetical predicted protein [Octopus vulgaris]|uniref:Uncharacterized protein n=1 Tax=Octopus vulgaris TaxID=6645 RepID=A0AA36AQ58_OCTVU|nr:Hypothetical predicted protein [Octopus vulgaris]